MKTTVIFQHEAEIYRTASGKPVPLILRVVTEPDARGNGFQYLDIQIRSLLKKL